MKRFSGGNQVSGGYYWHVGNWEVTTIADALGKLPGGADEKYLRAPLAALFVIAPVMGLAFALFLPFIGFGMLFYASTKYLVGHGRKALARVPEINERRAAEAKR